MLFVHDAIRRRHLLVGIAQDGIIGLDVLGELPVRFRIVDTGREIYDVGEGPDVFTALTERLAFGRSTTGERLRKPGKHHGLALVLREAVDLAIGALECERRGGIPGFQLGLQARRRRRTGLRGRRLLERRAQCDDSASERPSGK